MFSNPQHSTPHITSQKQLWHQKNTPYQTPKHNTTNHIAETRWNNNSTQKTQPLHNSTKIHIYLPKHKIQPNPIPSKQRPLHTPKDPLTLHKTHKHPEHKGGNIKPDTCQKNHQSLKHTPHIPQSHNTSPHTIHNATYTMHPCTKHTMAIHTWSSLPGTYWMTQPRYTQKVSSPPQSSNNHTPHNLCHARTHTQALHSQAQPPDNHHSFHTHCTPYAWALHFARSHTLRAPQLRQTLPKAHHLHSCSLTHSSPNTHPTPIQPYKTLS